MSKQARELAKLMGWTKYADGWLFQNKITFVNDPHTDLNAMAEVWKVLHKQGLWFKFWDEWWDNSEQLEFCNSIYPFLNDLPGQVEAAITVLRKDGKP